MKLIILESQLRRIVENNEILDQILDKINNEGMGSLTYREREFLKKYSTDKEPTSLGFDVNENTGKIIKSSVPNSPELIFDFSEMLETDENMVYYGSIYYDKKEYVGSFVCDKDNKLESIEFWIWGVDDEDPVNLLDERDGFVSDLELFFEYDVLPGIMS